MLNQAQAQQFCRARRDAIALQYQTLNPQQRQAVLCTEGPLLLLAGAGSGKTTVLIHRVANLMRYGRGSDSAEVPEWVEPEDLEFLRAYVEHPAPEGRERADRLCALDPAPPWSILAITFTNKAAGELKDRLERMLGPQSRDVWASTFHSACVRILRRDIEKLGFPASFTIYDTDDAQRVMKDCLKELNLDDKRFPPRSVLSVISQAKDKLQFSADFARASQAAGDFRLEQIARLYGLYAKKLGEAGARDFDDLILPTVRLLEQAAPGVEASQRCDARIVPAGVDEHPARLGLEDGVELRGQSGGVQGGAREHRGNQPDALFLQQAAVLGGAEIEVDNVQIGHRNPLPCCSRFQGKVQGEVRLSAAIVAADHGNPRLLAHRFPPGQAVGLPNSARKERFSCKSTGWIPIYTSTNRVAFQ